MSHLQQTLLASIRIRRKSHPSNCTMFLHCRNDFHFRTNSSLQIQHQRCFDSGAGNSSTTSSTAARRWPTRCGSSCTPVPTGCYSTCVLQSELEPAAAHRVRHDSSASLEDRQPYHRARQPHSYRTRLMLPGGRDVQSCRAQAATIWTISQRGDDAPLSPDPFTPNASTASSTQPICRAWRAERPSVPRTNSPSDHASACIRSARPLLSM